ncbi:MAG: hypothetical protein AAGA59_04305 [Actinomycetota bacterium]
MRAEAGGDDFGEAVGVIGDAGDGDPDVHLDVVAVTSGLADPADFLVDLRFEPLRIALAGSAGDRVAIGRPGHE